MTIGVIGGGAFGTGLAAVFAHSKKDVRLWLRDEEAADIINRTHQHPKRLPNVELPSNLIATSELENLRQASCLLLVLPAQTTRQWIAENINALPHAPIICCAKGLDRETAQFQTQIVEAVAGARSIGALSGPGFAAEIARGLPTAMTLAAPNMGCAEDLQNLISSKTLRLYASDDPIGVQFGGAMKNIIAIGCGVAMGAGLGQSARAALLTRGFSEMVRLGIAMGGKVESFGGLAGIGDLTLTATSETSRNYALGLAIGSETAPKSGTTTEGAYTARVALQLARNNELELPVIGTISRLIEGEINPKEALQYLFSRPLGKEF